ncbi:MAG: DNA polymerase III subunit delta [Cocleimonas sp.]|nr:DNA polymerase III subunit delta [Cocleimonas sp.]
MQLKIDQLPNFLLRKENFKPVFFLSGEEPLQMMEAADMIRSTAQGLGFTEREILQVDNSFSWNELFQSSNALSLFSEKKILDLRMANAKPGAAGGKALREYVNRPPDDKVLLIQMDKLDFRSKNTAWVKALDKAGVMIQVWKLSPPQTLGWVANRLRKKNMQPSQDAVRFLTERIEGNLLAAAQEINKLHLLHGEGEISVAQVQASVSDSSRFSTFDLSDAVMIGDTKRVQHVLHVLQQENAAIPLVLWTLSNLSRQLYEACYQLEKGASEAAIIHKIPYPQQKNFRIALQRLKAHADWQLILQQNADIDRLSKGLSEGGNKGMGRVWAGMLELSLLLSGIQLIPRV